jgi:hypothetical protein
LQGTSGQAQLEWWNAGIMGSGIMQYWVKDKICVDDKIKMANILLKTNLPVFHHSIIPFLRQAFNLIKYSIFSLSYRFSETFNYFKSKTCSNIKPHAG